MCVCAHTCVFACVEVHVCIRAHVCLYVWKYVCMNAHTCVSACGGYVCVMYTNVFKHVEAKGQPQVSFLRHHPPFFEAGSLTSLEPTRQTRLASQ